MNIIVDGFKVIKKDDGNIVLFDYQITDNNKISINPFDFNHTVLFRL